MTKPSKRDFKMARDWLEEFLQMGAHDEDVRALAEVIAEARDEGSRSKNDGSAVPNE